MTETPFDNVEAAHEYVGLLVEAVQQARAEVAQDLAGAAAEPDARPLEALRIVSYKLERLEAQLSASRRLLNDLRRLRRLLLGEPDPVVSGTPEENEPWEDV
jgi:hypothetical protein